MAPSWIAIAMSSIRLSTRPADGLRAEESPVGAAEEDLDGEQGGPGVVPGVGVRVEVDLLVVLVAEAPERLLVHTGPGDRAPEGAEDRGALRAAEPRVAPGDHVGHDPTLPVRRPRQRDQTVLAGHAVRLLDCVADGEDVRVARTHLVVHEDPAPAADREAGAPREGGLRAHADAEHHDVRGRTAGRTW